MIQITLVCDGTSDASLIGPLDWFMRQHFGMVQYRSVMADAVVPAKGALAGRLARAYELYGGDLIVCHRDSEKVDFQVRVNEIRDAAENLPVKVVPAVPVRMIEAWLLFDESALRSAASNSAGRNELNLPGLRRCEQLPDPKELLHTLLRSASGLGPQRIKKFNVNAAQRRLTDFIDDYSAMRMVPSFSAFESAFIGAVTELV